MSVFTFVMSVHPFTNTAVAASYMRRLRDNAKIELFDAFMEENDVFYMRFVASDVEAVSSALERADVPYDRISRTRLLYAQVRGAAPEAWWSRNLWGVTPIRRGAKRRFFDPW